MNRRQALTIALFAALLLAGVALRLFIGGSDALDNGALEIRATRVIAGVSVGAALAVAGVLLQSLLRNPLASPDLIGLASGSGLGIMFTLYLAALAGNGIASMDSAATAPASLVGAFAALSIVYTLSQRRGLLDPISLILVGVTVSILCSAGIQLIRHLMPLNASLGTQSLLFGTLRDDTPPLALWSVAAITLVSTGIGALLGPAMDAASLGDDEARSVGLNLAGLRLILFSLSGILTAASVVIAGPIGFVGLICPHVVRLLAGPSHRTLVIASALAGAALLVFADSAVRAITLPTGRMPISIITSLIGGPTLIYLLRREQRGLTPPA